MNRLFIKWNRIVALAVVFGLTAVLSLQAGKAAQAAPQEKAIRAETNIGFQGYIKQNEWYPARLTLTNNTDDDLKGEVVVSARSSNQGGTTDYIVPAELPRQTSVQLTVAIPGDVLDKNSSKIQFYKESYKSGNTIPIVGKDFIDVRATGSYTIGVISRDPDTLNFMPSLNQRGYDITVIPITEDELPDESILLDTLDTLVINDTATAAWSERKVQAIKDWVQQGGTLVLSGGAGYSKTAEAFKTIAPVEAAGTSELTGASALESVGGAPIKLEQPITISAGEITEGQTVLSEKGVPLVISRKVGFGAVLYAAFDPSLEPLSTWAGSAMLWAKLLQNSLSPLQPGMMKGSENMYWNMQNIINQFPSIKPPDFLMLLIMFAVYMFIAAPVLYMILAKADRREWAWWLIPALSVITGITIFFFGAEDKRVISAHTVEIIELTGQGDGVRSGATGLFVPAGGTIKAKFDENMHLIAYPSDNQSGNLMLDGKTQVIMEEDSTTAVWRSVPYWSTRKAWIAKKTMNGNAGKLSLVYEQSNGVLQLTVTNDTPTDLTHVSLLINGQSQFIGDLKRGESGQTGIPASTVPQSGYYSYGQSIFPHSSNRSNDGFNRQRELVDNYMNRNNGGFVPVDPVIVGFSIDHESSYNVNSDGVRADNLKMWVQKLGDSFIEGDRAVVPAGLVKPVIMENTLTRMDNYGNGVISVGEGELVFEYLVPNVNEVVYDKLDIIINNNFNTPNLTWSVWHEASGKWTDPTAALAAPSEYLIQKQTLRMKLAVTSNAETTLPQVALEGDVVKR